MRTEILMLIYEDTTAVAASRAYELAQTGMFEDFVAIERELFAEGFGEEIDSLDKPAVKNAITRMCMAMRRVDTTFEH
jgi:hypothetical protein